MEIADFYGYSMTELEKLLESIQLMLLIQFSLFVDG